MLWSVIIFFSCHIYIFSCRFTCSEKCFCSWPSWPHFLRNKYKSSEYVRIKNITLQTYKKHFQKRHHMKYNNPLLILVWGHFVFSCFCSVVLSYLFSGFIYCHFGCSRSNCFHSGVCHSLVKVWLSFSCYKFDLSLCVCFSVKLV